MHNFTLALIVIVLAPPLVAPIAMAVRALDRHLRRSTLSASADARRAELNALIG